MQDKIDWNSARELPPLSDRTEAEKAMFPTLSAGLWANRAPKACAEARWRTLSFRARKTGKPLGFAEVSIILDNSDRKLKIDFDTVTVTRRVHRSGEGEYFINKSPCRLKDIYELFMDTGIGREGYSVVGQGKIDEILSSKSEDRRHIFEEAAGISKYKYRKNRGGEKACADRRKSFEN